MLVKLSPYMVCLQDDDIVRIALLENGSLAAGIRREEEIPVHKPGPSASKPILIHIKFIFYNAGVYSFTLE